MGSIFCFKDVGKIGTYIDKSLLGVMMAILLSSCKNPEMSPISLIQLLQAGGLVSGSILSDLGLALLYKGMSRKEAKEHL